MSKLLNLRLRVWAWGLLIAVVSAIANAGTLALGAPDFVWNHWRDMMPMLALAAAKEVFFYLRKSPLPALPPPDSSIR